MEQKAGCRGKKVYFDKIAALVVANKRKEQGVEYLRAYLCEICRFWHLTKKRER